MKCLLDTANGFTVVMKKLLFKLFVLIAFFLFKFTLKSSTVTDDSKRKKND